MSSPSNYSLLWKHEELHPVTFTTDGSRVAAFGLGHLYMLDGRGKPLWKHDGMSPAAMTPDGSRVAGFGYDHVYILDREGEQLWKHGPISAIWMRAAMTPDGSRVAVASWGVVYMLDGVGKLLWKYELGGHEVWSVDITPDGGRLVVFDGNLYFLDGRGELLRMHEHEIVESVTMTLDGSRVAVVSSDYYERSSRGTLHMLDGLGESLWNYGPVESEVEVAITSDGSRVAAVSYEDGQLHMLDRQGHPLWKYGPPTDRVKSVAMTLDGNRVALVSDDDGHLYVLDGHGELLWKHTEEDRMVSIDMAPDGSLIATQSEPRKEGSLFKKERYSYHSCLFGVGVDNEVFQSADARPGKLASWYRLIRCSLGIHHGIWEYQTRNTCEQLLICPVHGHTRRRDHHRWETSEDKREMWRGRCRRCKHEREIHMQG